MVLDRRESTILFRGPMSELAMMRASRVAAASYNRSNEAPVVGTITASRYLLSCSKPLLSECSFADINASCGSPKGTRTN